MILVFLYIILVILFLIICLTLFSTIEIHIQNIKYFSDNIKNEKFNKDYNINLKLKLFDKLTYLKLNFKKNNKKKNIKKVLNVNKLKENFKKNRKSLDIGIFKLTKYFKIKKLNLKVQIGLEDAALNAITVGIASTAIAVILRNFVEKESKIYWKILPIYGRNSLKINVDAIIGIKLKDLLLRKEIFNKKRKKIDKKSIPKNRTINLKNRTKNAQ